MEERKGEKDRDRKRVERKEGRKERLIQGNGSDGTQTLQTMVKML